MNEFIMNGPLVSVIVPVYNFGEQLLTHCFILVMPYWLNGESRLWQILLCLGAVFWLTFLIAENLKMASKNVADLICNI